MLLFPFPNMLEQLLASQLIPMAHGAFFDQFTFHHTLRGNTRVIRTRQPQHFLSVHARFAGENVLDRVVQHMPHVQHARDIRWRDHNRITRSFVAHPRRVSGEAIVFLPKRIPLRFNCLRFVSLRNFRHGFLS